MNESTGTANKRNETTIKLVLNKSLIISKYILDKINHYGYYYWTTVSCQQQLLYIWLRTHPHC